MVPVELPRRRLSAPTLRRKPSRSIAASTRSVVSACTPGSSLTTRETVLMLTPASRATSLIVARRTRPPPWLDNVVIVRAMRHLSRVACQPTRLSEVPSATRRLCIGYVSGVDTGSSRMRSLPDRGHDPPEAGWIPAVERVRRSAFVVTKQLQRAVSNWFRHTAGGADRPVMFDIAQTYPALSRLDRGCADIRTELDEVLK